MENRRRKFLKYAGMGSLGMAGLPFIISSDSSSAPGSVFDQVDASIADGDLSIIGQFGPWANSLTEGKLPTLSFRNKEWSDPESWRVVAKKKLEERLGLPDLGGLPSVKVNRQYNYGSLHIEELRWQLP